MRADELVDGAADPDATSAGATGTASTMRSGALGAQRQARRRRGRAGRDPVVDDDRGAPGDRGASIAGTARSRRSSSTRSRSSTSASCSGVTPPARTASGFTTRTPSAIAPTANSSCDGRAELADDGDVERQRRGSGRPRRRPRRRRAGCRTRPRPRRATRRAPRRVRAPRRRDRRRWPCAHGTPAASAVAGMPRRTPVVLCTSHGKDPHMSEPAAIELGLDTFGDVTRDESGALLSDAADDPQRRRPGGARRRGRAVVLRGGGAPPPRVRRLEPRDRARRRGRAHRAASTSAPRSPSSPATTRCASTSGSRPSTRSRAVAPR